MQQLAFDEFTGAVGLAPQIIAARDQLAGESDPTARGAIFTRREIVDFMLDLIGYTSDQPLFTRSILEPSFGAGDFLIPIVERLLDAWKRAGSPDPVKVLSPALRGVELHVQTAQATYQRVAEQLIEAQISPDAATTILATWLIQDDFLLTELLPHVDLIVGNPPYVRQERIPAALLSEYRRRYRTIYDRADLYIPFIERSLQLLARKGVIGVLCADRWMKNRYGAPLREFITAKFHVRTLVDLVDAPAFHEDVAAYPAIALIQRDTTGPTQIATPIDTNPATLSQLAQALRRPNLAAQHPSIHEVTIPPTSTAPWILSAAPAAQLITRLEAAFPTLEQAGCRVGIGVATGADRVYIGAYSELPVEEEHKLPLVTTRDLVAGTIAWQGLGVINPFDAHGRLVPLENLPKLRTYLEVYRTPLAARHCARKNPAAWYRTIDKIDPQLAAQPKLLIPDIKGHTEIAFDSGKYYPHHNLYYITSNMWDLRALRALLRSPITKLFLTNYSVRMRGGYLRYQAQYLRRICIPAWQDIPVSIQNALCNSSDEPLSFDLLAQLYQFSADEITIMEQYGA